MVYNLADRFDHLRTRMKGLNDNKLVYTRESCSITIENFTPEKVDVTQWALHGVTLLTETAQDFVFDTAELKDLDSPLPMETDEITWDGRKYEVLSVGEEIFTYTTSSQKAIRVHAKQV